MSTTSGSLRQRAGQSKKTPVTTGPSRDDETNGIPKPLAKTSSVSTEWDFKIALVIITSLAFATRFWGIGHPNEVVFDEVHFGKVCRLSPASKQSRIEGEKVEHNC